MFNNLFKKKKYLDCPHLRNSLHFFYDEIRACCSNVSGPIFYKKYSGGNISWDYIYNERKKIFKYIGCSIFKEKIPEVCKGCCDINKNLTKKKPVLDDNKIKRIYIQNHMTCNAKCIYCTFKQVERGSKYKVLPIIKSLIENNLLAQNAIIYMSGGEVTISDEFEDLLSTLISHLNSQIEILTSGIKYCKSIEQAFRENKCRLMISLDSGCKDTYFKIKQVNCFDKVIDNLKKYLLASNNAKETITLKYILVDDINDNINEIENFLCLAEDLGIKNVRLDIDYEKYKFTQDVKVPKHYFDLYEYFNNSAKNKCLNVLKYDQVEAILNKSK